MSYGEDLKKLVKQIGAEKLEKIGKKFMGKALGIKFLEKLKEGMEVEDAQLEACIEVMQEKIESYNRLDVKKLLKEPGFDLSGVHQATTMQKLCIIARNSESKDLKMVFSVLFYTYILNSMSPRHASKFATEITKTCSEMILYGTDVGKNKKTEDVDDLFDIFKE